MRPIPLVRAWCVTPFVRFLLGVGAPVYRWLESAGLPAVSIEVTSQPLPMKRVFDFIHRAARAEGAETLGLDVGRHVAADSFGAWGRMLTGTPTLYDRISASIEEMPQNDTGLDMWLEVDGPDARVCYRYLDGLGPGTVHAEDFTLMVCFEAFRRSVGEDFRPDAIVLARPRPERFRRDEMFRGVQLVHHGAANEIVFPSEQLECAMPLLPTPIGHDESDTLRPAPSLDLAGSIEDTVAALLPRGYPSVEEIAELAEASVRSLQRELARSGLSYSTLVDRARLRLASEYLADPTATVMEVGLQLGYGDSTAFSRAFHRWSGTSPTQYRQQLAH